LWGAKFTKGGWGGPHKTSRNSWLAFESTL
jgi:hypothetical protein